MLLIEDSRIRIHSSHGVTTILALLMLALLPGLAAATTVNATAESTVGSEVFSALLTIDDAITPGSLVLSLAVNGDDSKITIRGFASGLADGTGLNGVSVLGDDVKRSVLNLGQNMLGNHPIDPSCTTCDVVVSFNKPPRGATDRSVSFTISDSTRSLDLNLLNHQDFAVLLQVKGAYNSKGMEHGFFFRDRKMVILDGSINTTPIPEPSTALLLVLGLAGLSLGERRTRALWR